MPDVKRLKALEDENGKLKKLLAEQMLAGEAAKAVFEFVETHKKTYSSSEVQKFVNFIFEQSVSKSTSPQDEAKLFFSAIG